MKTGMAKELAALLVGTVLILFGCGGGEHQQAGGVTKMIAVMHPTQGNNVHGVVAFTKESKGVHVVAQIEGLSPGPHGFHVHEYGDCSSPDAVSAGGHFNPDQMLHAAPGADKRHEGDLGNIEVDDKGVGRLDVVDSHLSMDGPRSILGRSLIVHANADDFTTQPTGNAGGRSACGVIGITR